MNEETKDQEKLLPCPFCGNSEIEIRTVVVYQNGESSPEVVRCRYCHISIGSSDVGVAEKKWNTRPLEDALRAELMQTAQRLTHVSNSESARANKAEAELRQVREANRWIPVSERVPMPELKQTGTNDYKCLVSIHGRTIQGSFGHDGFGNYGFFTPREYPLRDVTHWRPLPKPPEA